MSIGLEPKPINGDRVRTSPYFSTRVVCLEDCGPSLVLLGACLATLTMWTPDPFADLAYTTYACLLAAWAIGKGEYPSGYLGILLGLLAAWGFAQLALHATEYRYSTIQSALRSTGWVATAVASYSFTRCPTVPEGMRHHSRGRPQTRERLLDIILWFGFVMAVISVISYHTSPSRVLWIFPAPYPDVWGPFLSRNHFAQFLELMLPAALWRATSREGDWIAWVAGGTMLTAGIASASRAGALVLVLEACVILWRSRRTKHKWILAAATIVCSTLVGGGTLVGRLHQPDAMRPEIYRSALAMMAQRPFTGYGLGTFAEVYPEFARVDAGVRVEHAHNDWLEWATEGGIPYLLLWILLAACLASRAWRSVWGLGVLAVLLHAFVDYPFARSGVAAWFFLLLGMLSGENRGARAALL